MKTIKTDKLLIVVLLIFVALIGWAIISACKIEHQKKLLNACYEHINKLNELSEADGIYYDAAENLIDSFKNGDSNNHFNATKYYESAKHDVDSIYTKNGWNCDFE